MRKTTSPTRLSSSTHTISNITLQDVATRCRVHKSTVYRALIGSKRVGQETTQKILSVAREMGYDHTLNLPARQLSSRKTGRAITNHLIVLFFPPTFVEDFYFFKLFQGIQQELQAHQYDLVTTVLDRENEISLPLCMVRGDVDGAIMLHSEELGTRLIDKIRYERNVSHCPLVSLMSPLAECAAVLADERDGSKQALQHLIELGHRRILFTNGPEVPEYHLNERLQGYREACQDAGLQFKKIIKTHILKSNAVVEEMRLVVEKYLNGKHGFSAVMTRNDAHAVILRRVLAENGLRVPEDISLVGFDDTRPLSFQYAELSENYLTSVCLPLEEIGRAASRLLVQIINNETPRDANVVLPTQLVPRETTAPPTCDLSFSSRDLTQALNSRKILQFSPK